MNRIFINIYIPAAGKNIELKVSLSLKIGQLTEMIKEYVAKDETISYTPTIDTRLCDSRKGNVYSYNSSLSELELSEGYTFILV